MKIDRIKTAEFLKERDDFLLLLHISPDGDTVGSCYGLLHALRGLGKRANAICYDEIPEKFGYIVSAGPPQELDAKTVVAVDVADLKLLGKGAEIWEDKIHLCIDHHPSNRMYAERTLLDASSAATAEIIYELIKEMGCPITPEIAGALYTGIATDTGCFKFSNTTADSHRIAAVLIETGIDYAEINRVMFDTKTRARIELERQAMKKITFSPDGRCALLCITADMMKNARVTEDELDGITSIPRKIEGVLVGMTLREQQEGRYKLSVRTRAPVDASMFCAQFGGGGHARAAGCELSGSLEQIKVKLMDAALSILKNS